MPSKTSLSLRTINCKIYKKYIFFLLKNVMFVCMRNYKFFIKNRGFVSPKIFMKTEFSELPTRLDTSSFKSESCKTAQVLAVARPTLFTLNLLRISPLSYFWHIFHTYISSGTNISI